MKAIKIVEKLVSLSPRQFERENLTRDYLTEALKKNDVPFVVQGFKVSVPIYKKYYLKADGRDILCFPTSLKSGKIGKDHDLVSSLDFSYESSSRGNINFNPHCDSISLANFYDAPSVAVSRKDVEKIKNAKIVDGLVEVEKKTFRSYSILVGNRSEPKNVIFAHYDCFFEGAIDNASGVAVCLNMTLKNKEILKENLVVFCGAEELSFDQPDYWGKCFRAFENKNENILNNANRIIIVDCVGTGEPELKNDKQTVSLYFAKNSNDKENIFVVTSVEKDPENFYGVYHSELDGIKGVSEAYLQEAVEKCLSIIE